MIQRLFEGMYMPHGYCLLWEPWLVSLHAVSDLLTFGAYSAIPVAIWIFLSKRTDLELKGLARLFAAFILWCGLTHLFGFITLWRPVYELQGAVKAITAGVSVLTAGLIFPLIPKALAIPSPKQMAAVNAQLELEVASHKRTLADLERARNELEERVAQRTSELEQATKQFRSLFEYAPVAMLMVDGDGTINQANQAALRLLRADASDILSAPLDGVLPGVLKQIEPVTAPDAALFSGRDGNDLHGRRATGETFPVEIGLNPLPGANSLSLIVSVFDVSSRREHEQRVSDIMQELSHRAKNLLAVIQGMARQVIASSESLEDFAKSFGDRLHALARSHDLLVGANWNGVSLRDLTRAQLSIAQRDDAALSIEGPDVVLSPAATQNIGLALHELVTNALKHGALAQDAGTVSVTWRVTGTPGRQRIALEWRERVPYARRVPTRSGFGRTVLERIVPTALGGMAELDFAPAGLIWTLDAPMSRLV